MVILFLTCYLKYNTVKYNYSLLIKKNYRSKHSLAVFKIARKPIQILLLYWKDKTVLYFEVEKAKKKKDASFRENEKLLEEAWVKNTKPPVIKNYLSLELLVGKFYFL